MKKILYLIFVALFAVTANAEAVPTPLATPHMESVTQEASTFDPYTTPLTFEAKTAGATVTFTMASVMTLSIIKYSTDGTTWVNYTSGTGIQLNNVGDKVMFRGNNAAYAISFDPNQYSYFSCDEDCYIYGNIMSLINSNDYATTTSITANYALAGLFYGGIGGNTHILSDPTKALVLPATTLSVNCYNRMFKGCSGLTVAPSLPAETMASRCYMEMFADCTSLTTAPDLPATSLASMCYQYMFGGCTALTQAPDLPATTLATDCYSHMFHGCISLKKAPMLPAPTLTTSCYDDMFYNCQSLTSVTCLATDISANNCTFYWLYGVAASGTFYKAASMTSWPTNSVSGIPTGWTTGTARTLDNIPDGWTVTVGGQDVSVVNGTAAIPVDSTVTLTPMYPAKVKSVKLVDEPSTGAINGLFSVSSTKQVWFSQGNLQYTKSTGVWSFMEHQYSTVETTGSYCTNDYGNRDVVSLFGWATSGYNHGATCYQPYSTNTTNENYYAYGDASYNLYDQTGQADWGYNAISNGGNTVNSDWRTLTTVEWQYLFANHTTGWSSVNGVNGYVIRPDGVSTAIAASYTASDWDTEEAAGAVFLPAAGYRNSYVGTYVYDKGSIGRYWSSSADDGSNANYVNFSNSSLGSDYTMNRKYGLSVRLVKDAY